MRPNPNSQTRRLLTAFLLVAFAGPAAATIQFEEVEGAFSELPVTQSYGSAWADFNGDGCVDLFLSNHQQRPILLANNCDGTFHEVEDDVFTVHPRVERSGTYLWWPDFHGAAWGDYDNDGDPDLIISTGGVRGLRTQDFSTTNHFWENEHGHFKEKSGKKHLGNAGARGRTPNWLDFDGDGFLDIALGQLDPLDRTSVLRRQMEGKFEECEVSNDSWDTKDPALIRSLFPLTPVRMGVKGRLQAVVAQGGNFSRWGWKTQGCNVELKIWNRLKVPGATDMATGDFNNDLRPDFLIPTRRYGGSRYAAVGNRVNTMLMFGRNSQETLVLPDSRTLKLYYPGDMFPLSDVRIGEAGVGADPYLRVGEDQLYVELSRDNTHTHGLFEGDGGVFRIGYHLASRSWHLGLQNSGDVPGKRLRITVELDTGINASDISNSNFGIFGILKSLDL
ncbi:FG-GAP repeat domain-containing protein [Hoeflea sp.]|uniref:FG-GAP repeat domain-containing protein n=1 Tax=Hoeflea sp. TaxID=1940281 RepID=UPI003B010D51